MSHIMMHRASGARGELVTGTLIVVALLLSPLYGLLGLALQLAMVIAAPLVMVVVIARALTVPAAR